MFAKLEEIIMTTLSALNEAITNRAFFHGMNPEHLTMLTDGAKAVQSRACAVPGRRAANQFYLIASGKITVEAHEPADGTMVVQTLGAGEVLGWSWLLPPFVWHFQARA